SQTVPEAMDLLPELLQHVMVVHVPAPIHGFKNPVKAEQVEVLEAGLGPTSVSFAHEPASCFQPLGRCAIQGLTHNAEVQVGATGIQASKHGLGDVGVGNREQDVSTRGYTESSRQVA